ncbi:MAG: nucleotide pyrophosphohydrolase [Candidatus Peribacteria bacterium]|nr:MAG: nucleotide pyrophosphohydrolase [Candidatus Peribacteria bacterium]
MLNSIQNIIQLSKKRINFLHHVDSRNYYKGYQTYIDAIQDELSEATQEIKQHNTVYLEDELGDVFWCYICLLHSLEEDGYIRTERVFQRCLKKFSERLQADYDRQAWVEIKHQQKQKLKKEHEEKHGK